MSPERSRLHPLDPAATAAVGLMLALGSATLLAVGILDLGLEQSQVRPLADPRAGLTVRVRQAWRQDRLLSDRVVENLAELHHLRHLGLQ